MMVGLFMVFGSLEMGTTEEIFIFVSYLTNLAVVCYTADNIRHMANGLLPEIRRLPLDLEGDSQNELVFFFLKIELRIQFYGLKFCFYS